MTIAILWPTFVLVALVFAVWAGMFVNHVVWARRGAVQPRRDRPGEMAINPDDPQMPTRNLANLFEMPVLYFALVPLLMLTRHADHTQVALAWTFVLLRIGHSVVHIARAPLGLRFAFWLLSCVALAAMWAGFAIDMAAAAAAMPPGYGA